MRSHFAMVGSRGRWWRQAWRCATVVAFLYVLGGTAPAHAGDRVRAVGSAASGLGADGVIADLDADGVPDIAIADRLGRHGDTEYELRIRLSSGGDDTLRFQSAQAALTLTAIDIDHDDDVDLVFTPVLGRRIVSVWLNDGTGHFSRWSRHAAASSDSLMTELPRVVGLSLPVAPAPVPLVLAGTRRQIPTCADDPAWASHHDRRGRALRDPAVAFTSLTRTRISPRGPPAAPASITV